MKRFIKNAPHKENINVQRVTSKKKMSLLVLIVMVMCVIFSGIFMQSCSRYDYVDDIFEKDLSFLSINRSDFDYNNLSANEMNIVQSAFKRLNIIFENGHYRIKQQSGKQINISEDLFAFFKKALDSPYKKMSKFPVQD
ncbi:MAG: hypothetical protein LBD59_09230 [Prevotellaceae bacterium]|jgi:hypothetical protein|nr:hypothetical protein [Prevotellaceae bacterium]